MNSNAKEEMNPIKEKYKATIIIPAYNAETTIHRAVDSAVNQTTKEPYEILLMDDGSTDSTSHILDDYAKLHKNIRTIHQKTRVLPEQERMLPLLLLALISSGLMPMIMPMKSFLKSTSPIGSGK